jgi:hypothetical protein
MKPIQQTKITAFRSKNPTKTPRPPALTFSEMPALLGYTPAQLRIRITASPLEIRPSLQFYFTGATGQKRYYTRTAALAWKKAYDALKLEKK